uniref:Uncharacterized protein n=1 Tax=Anguilla anguilla TaxID=7936 RepID=A0A0E9SID5_ANGAN
MLLSLLILINILVFGWTKALTLKSALKVLLGSLSLHWAFYAG